ncbi:MAG: hypothetical protein H3Z53_06015 [archaeon]|nr:hypothetical protein [archaeon]MCP8313911.1 hypothetical protein [archaeon]
MVNAKYKIYKPRKILNVYKHCDGGWFWNKYSANPYIGCHYGCLYCYEWDRKYNPYDDPEDFDKIIQIKENASELLRKELRDKPIDIISIGDWQPVEAKYGLSREMLKVILDLGFPVFINEKSPFVLRDLDLIKKINDKSYANIGFSIITTKDDDIRRIFEPKAPTILSRFEAMKRFSKEGILTGIVFMPILPYIYDNDENLEEVIKKTKEFGGSYVLDASLTLWGYCKKKFYQTLEEFNPNLIPKYEKLYSDERVIRDYYKEIHRKVLELCKRYEVLNYIPRPIKFYPENIRLNKEVAGMLYLKAREFQLSGENQYKEWAYRKAAWTIDELEKDIREIYEEKGEKGLLEIPFIGRKLAEEIKELIKT